MATNDRTAYYYGLATPPAFNNAQVSQQTRTLLTTAWRDYFTV
jgi:hypothetical protein